jgi:pyrroloquinoline quinone biosynthesis protein B
MRAIVLGAAAGGGSPQWNCSCPVCEQVRAGVAPPRSQCSVAVSADSEGSGPGGWVLLNASPDLRYQIEATPALQPKQRPRSSPIEAVVLTSGEVDAIGGLLSMRERQPFALWATSGTHAALAANPVFAALGPDQVPRQTLRVGDRHHIAGLEIEAYPVPGKVPLYLEGAADSTPDETIGLAVSANGRTLHFIPGCAALDGKLLDRLRGAELVLFDGTLWTDDEMIRTGTGTKTGQRMGHMSVSDPAGTLAAFASLGVQRRVLVHMNNSNPILLGDTPERLAVERAGWEVAYDGMELAL